MLSVFTKTVGLLVGVYVAIAIIERIDESLRTQKIQDPFQDQEA